MEQVSETAGPGLITPEALESAAGSSNKAAATDDPVAAIRQAVEGVEPEDLLDLAEKLYGRPPTTDEGLPRKQPRNLI